MGVIDFLNEKLKYKDNLPTHLAEILNTILGLTRNFSKAITILIEKITPSNYFNSKKQFQILMQLQQIQT